MHPDEALDEMCKLMYAKMYDEETTADNTPFRLQKAIYGTTQECATSVRRVYSDANDYDVRVLRLRSPVINAQEVC